MLFNGANVAEKFDLSANGDRLRFTRDIANITMDTHGVERVDVQALGGADTVTVERPHRHRRDRAGHRPRRGRTAPPTARSITQRHERRAITINVAGDACRIARHRPPPTVRIRSAEPTDSLIVNGLDGDDAIAAAGLPAGLISLVIDSGAGNDTVAGAAGPRP